MTLHLAYVLWGCDFRSRGSLDGKAQVQHNSSWLSDWRTIYYNYILKYGNNNYSVHTLSGWSPCGLSFRLHELMRHAGSGSLVLGLMSVGIGVLSDPEAWMLEVCDSLLSLYSLVNKKKNAIVV